MGRELERRRRSSRGREGVRECRAETNVDRWCYWVGRKGLGALTGLAGDRDVKEVLPCPLGLDMMPPLVG